MDINLSATKYISKLLLILYSGEYIGCYSSPEQEEASDLVTEMRYIKTFKWPYMQKTAFFSSKNKGSLLYRITVKFKSNTCICRQVGRISVGDCIMAWLMFKKVDFSYNQAHQEVLLRWSLKHRMFKQNSVGYKNWTQSSTIKTDPSFIIYSPLGHWQTPEGMGMLGISIDCNSSRKSTIPSMSNQKCSVTIPT